MDVFVEKIVARKRTGKDYLLMTAIIIGGFILSIAIFSIAIIRTLAPLLVLLVVYGGYYFVKSTSLEFEYAVTNGDIDIDKIIARRKRKRIFSAMTKDIEIVAKIKSEKYTTEYKNITNKIEAMSSFEAQDLYFIVAPYKGQRTIVFFEPDSRMIESFRTKIPSKVFQ